MAFMKPQVVFGEWLQIDGRHGTQTIPADLAPDILAGITDTLTDDAEDFLERVEQIKDYIEGGAADVMSVDRVEGFGARLSAPGYMDCTDWAVFQTEQEALDYLKETYGDDDEGPTDDA